MTMTKRIAAILVMAFAFAALGFAANARADVAIPEGYVLIGDHCSSVIDDAWASKVDTSGDPKTVGYTAPEGKYVKAYCVKAGTEAYVYTTTGMPTSVTIDHPTKDSVSHWSVLLGDLPNEGPPNEEPPVNYCDPTQKPSGSIADWLDGRDAAECFTVKVVQTCGSLDVNVTGPDGIAWGAQGLLAPATPVWPGNSFPMEFQEDYNGGSVTINYWLVGGESDYLTGSSLPNLWDGTYATVTVDTDCERPAQPEPEYRTDTDVKSFCSADGVRTIQTSGQDLIREYVWEDDEWVLGEWEPVNSWAVISEEDVKDEKCATIPVTPQSGPSPDPEPEPTLAETGAATTGIAALSVASMLGGAGVLLRRRFVG